MEILLFLIAAGRIVVRWFAAKWFQEIAIEKGYESQKYFWICFLLTTLGYLLVIAMPDRKGQRQLDMEEPATLPEL